MILSDEDYKALVLHIATRMHEQCSKRSIEDCAEMVSIGIRRGVSRQAAAVFEDSFNKAFTEKRAGMRLPSRISAWDAYAQELSDRCSQGQVHPRQLVLWP